MTSNWMRDPSTGRVYPVVQVVPVEQLPFLSRGRQPRSQIPASTRTHVITSGGPQLMHSSSHPVTHFTSSSQNFHGPVHYQAAAPAPNSRYPPLGAYMNTAPISSTYASGTQPNRSLDYRYQRNHHWGQGEFIGSSDRAQRPQIINVGATERDLENPQIYTTYPVYTVPSAASLERPASRMQSPQPTHNGSRSTSISSRNFTMGNISTMDLPTTFTVDGGILQARTISSQSADMAQSSSRSQSRSRTSRLPPIDTNLAINSSGGNRSPRTPDYSNSRPGTPYHDLNGRSPHSGESHSVVQTPTPSIPGEILWVYNDHNSRGGSRPGSRESLGHGNPVTSIDNQQLNPLDTTNDNMIHGVTRPFNRLRHNGHCDVFTAGHPLFGQVTLKHPRIDDDKEALRRFHREARIWTGLRHRYILPFLGKWFSRGSWYLVSPFIENGSLGAYLKAYPLANRPRFLCELAEAVQYLHDQDIVHGDIKADNILVSKDKRALLADFGLAKMLDERTSSSKKGGGSTRWQAPELWHHERPSQRNKGTDVYSFGITVAEVLSGMTPYQEITLSAAVIRAVLKKVRPRKRPLAAPFVSQSYDLLWEIAESCWTKQSGRRPAIQTVLDRLQTLNVPSTPSQGVVLRWLCEMVMIRSKEGAVGMTAGEIGKGIEDFYPGILSWRTWSDLNDDLNVLYRSDRSGTGFPACFDRIDADGGTQLWRLPSDTEREKRTSGYLSFFSSFLS